MRKKKGVVTFLLKCPEDLWNQFKATITLDRTINDVLVEMIKERVEKYRSEREKGGSKPLLPQDFRDIRQNVV